MDSVRFKHFYFIPKSLQTFTVYMCEMFFIFIVLCIYGFAHLLKQSHYPPASSNLGSCIRDHWEKISHSGT